VSFGVRGKNEKKTKKKEILKKKKNHYLQDSSVEWKS
jgi:hypothetical protein